MKENQTYTVVGLIKAHTNDLNLVNTVRVGKFIKETKCKYIFDKFKTDKTIRLKLLREMC